MISEVQAESAGNGRGRGRRDRHAGALERCPGFGVEPRQVGVDGGQRGGLQRGKRFKGGVPEDGDAADGLGAVVGEGAEAGDRGRRGRIRGAPGQEQREDGPYGPGFTHPQAEGRGARPPVRCGSGTGRS